MPDFPNIPYVIVNHSTPVNAGLGRMSISVDLVLYRTLSSQSRPLMAADAKFPQSATSTCLDITPPSRSTNINYYTPSTSINFFIRKGNLRTINTAVGGSRRFLAPRRRRRNECGGNTRHCLASGAHTIQGPEYLVFAPSMTCHTIKESPFPAKLLQGHYAALDPSYLRLRILAQ